MNAVINKKIRIFIKQPQPSLLPPPKENPLLSLLNLSNIINLRKSSIVNRYLSVPAPLIFPQSAMSYWFTWQIISVQLKWDTNDLIYIIILVILPNNLTVSEKHIIYRTIQNHKDGRNLIAPVLCYCLLKHLLVLLGRLLNGILIAGEGGEGRKLGGTVPHRHLGMALGHVVRQMNNIVVISHFFNFQFSNLPYALCPPICALRSLAVAPSS